MKRMECWEKWIDLTTKAQRGEAATQSRSISRKDKKAAKAGDSIVRVYILPSKLGDFAPWREEFPTPIALSFQINCAGHANYEL